VRQDARLATVFDLEYEQRLARVADELKVAEAALNAEIAKVQWESHVQDTEMTRSLADFYEGAGTVHQESGALGVIRNDLARTHALVQSKAANDQELQKQTIQEEAQTEKLAAVQQALEVLKLRAEAAAAAAVPWLGSEQVGPLVARVDMLLNETQRIREWIAQGDLRAPVNGRVLHRHHPAGECIKSQQFPVVGVGSVYLA
jgi:multidrug resistance efflux pump